MEVNFFSSQPLHWSLLAMMELNEATLNSTLRLIS